MPTHDTLGTCLTAEWSKGRKLGVDFQVLASPFNPFHSSTLQNVRKH